MSTLNRRSFVTTLFGTAAAVALPATAAAAPVEATGIRWARAVSADRLRAEFLGVLNTHQQAERKAILRTLVDRAMTRPTGALMVEFQRMLADPSYLAQVGPTEFEPWSEPR